MNKLQDEWAILHKDIEKYERFSLLLKLVAVCICLFSFNDTVTQWPGVFLILVIWLQNGIWQTFRKRLEQRILSIEQHLLNKTNPDDIAFQLYTQWQNERQSTTGLVKEYCNNAIKPTVAYPYLLFVIVLLALN